ncbi:polysaccharide biosynthesis/export family protein [bacterium]|nr:polysaccharide biosynthesis/export family protein [bacterium]MBU1958919.1 polysaccharide biosynthesis/export family protein [bacterium]
MKFIIIVTMLFFSACSVKEYKLFQKENAEHLPQSQELNISYSSKIVPNDVLSIDIYNMNQKSNIMMPDSGAATVPDNNYVVYEDGTIVLPLLNTVKVEGLTIKEMNELLTDKYRAFLNAPYVKATVKNHKVYVLGEVTTNGVVPIEGETISVIEAIAQSGGLTDKAVRHRIRIISEENGKYVLSSLNFNEFSTLNMHNLMLKHNSIVYVEPKNSKAVTVAINDYLPIIQAVSSVLSTFVNIKYLTKD